MHRGLVETGLWLPDRDSGRGAQLQRLEAPGGRMTNSFDLTVQSRYVIKSSMRVPREREATKQVAARLAELLDEPLAEDSCPDGSPADLVLSTGDHTFLIEFTSSGATVPISSALRQLEAYRSSLDARTVPLVVVPYMGETGSRLCQEAGVSWIDLSGNAGIRAPGLRIVVEGQPNRFKRPGRPSSVFAPKSSRITRWMLMHPNRWASQREIARETDMDEGYTSRIVARLEEDELIIRNPEGEIRPRDPDVLLDAWSEDYDFFKHRVLRGHVAARSGGDLMRRVAEGAAGFDSKTAFTGLPAAARMTEFAAFRIVTVYSAAGLEAGLLEQLGFREGSTGANLWFVIPNDEGVFHGVSERDGVRCVHPVQAYLDLLALPERAQEAAEQLRRAELNWATDAG